MIQKKLSYETQTMEEYIEYISKQEILLLPLK